MVAEVDAEEEEEDKEVFVVCQFAMEDGVDIKLMPSSRMQI
jgi:hypothetical protein